jgi:hypothetical protein
MRRSFRHHTARLLVTSVFGFVLAGALTQAGVCEADSPARGRLDTIWSSVLDRIPAGWKRAKQVEIRWVSDREMDRLVADQEEEDDQRGAGGRIQGFYDRAPDSRSPSSITIRESLGSEEATFVLTHEYAHMVWDESLTRRDRTDYRRIWEDQRRRRRLVSRYAGDSPEEGFAEAVASYLLQNDKLKRRDALSYDFVADLVHAAVEAEREAIK